MFVRISNKEDLVKRTAILMWVCPVSLGLFHRQLVTSTVMIFSSCMQSSATWKNEVEVSLRNKYPLLKDTYLN